MSNKKYQKSKIILFQKGIKKGILFSLFNFWSAKNINEKNQTLIILKFFSKN